MSQRHLYPSRRSPAPLSPVVITVGGVCAGFAINEAGGFRFVGGHPRFNLLDGSRFRRLDDVKNAARHLFAAASPLPINAHVHAEATVPALNASRKGYRS
ncbi:MAG: hypothetical protein NW215_14450 [Hyphomicrobiales bacterium]|nr:hypothetical protein [Hyphomicrobiales bacterium]